MSLICDLFEGTLPVVDVVRIHAAVERQSGNDPLKHFIKCHLMAVLNVRFVECGITLDYTMIFCTANATFCILRVEHPCGTLTIISFRAHTAIEATDFWSYWSWVDFSCFQGLRLKFVNTVTLCCWLCIRVELVTGTSSKSNKLDVTIFVPECTSTFRYI